METKVWPNGLGAEVTMKSRRISIQDQGAMGFAVAIRAKPAQSGEGANVWYGRNVNRSLSFSALAVWAYTAWKCGVKSEEAQS